jgi:hypothetical protein
MSTAPTTPIPTPASISSQPAADDEIEVDDVTVDVDTRDVEPESTVEDIETVSMPALAPESGAPADSDGGDANHVDDDVEGGRFPKILKAIGRSLEEFHFMCTTGFGKVCPFSSSI